MKKFIVMALLTISMAAHSQKGEIRLVYSFLTKSFYDTSYLNKKNPKGFRTVSPPFQINEKEDIVLQLVDINPFLFCVKQASLQTDHITDRIISEKNWDKELKFDFQPIQGIIVDPRLGLIKEINQVRAALVDSLKFVTELLSGTRPLEVLKPESLRIQKHIDAINDSITYLTSEYKRKYDQALISSNQQKAQLSSILIRQDTLKIKISSLLKNAKPDTTGRKKLQVDTMKVNEQLRALQVQATSLRAGQEVDKVKMATQSDTRLIARLENQLSQVKQMLSDVQTEENDRKVLVKQQISLNKEIRKIEDPATQENELLKSISSLQRNVLLLNKLVVLHNRLLSTVHIPTNDVRVIRRKMDSLFVSIIGIPEDRIDQYYIKCYDSIELHSIQAYSLVNILKKDSNASKYDVVAEKITSFQSSIRKMDFDKLIRQIKFMVQMVEEENFQLPPTKVYSFTDNVDVVRFRVELKPYSLSGGFPQGLTNDPLDFTVYLKGGIKFDISSGFVLDFGLRDPDFYFARPTDSTAVVKRNKRIGNVNPSIALFLNGYVRSGSWIKIGGCFGTGVSNSGRVRIYLGPSFLIGRSERVILSGGIAFGARARLANGYHVNKEITDVTNLPAEVPTVVDRYDFGYFVGVSFNLTGDQNKKFIESIKFN